MPGHIEAWGMPRVASDAAAHVGQRMAARRLQIGSTQDQVAAQSGIDSSNIRAYENGRAMPSLHSLIRIAEALDVDPGVLIAGMTSDLFAINVQDGRRRSA